MDGMFKGKAINRFEVPWRYIHVPLNALHRFQDVLIGNVQSMKGIFSFI